MPSAIPTLDPTLLDKQVESAYWADPSLESLTISEAEKEQMRRDRILTEAKQSESDALMDTIRYIQILRDGSLTGTERESILNPVAYARDYQLVRARIFNAVGRQIGPIDEETFANLAILESTGEMRNYRIYSYDSIFGPVEICFHATRTSHHQIVDYIQNLERVYKAHLKEFYDPQPGKPMLVTLLPNNLVQRSYHFPKIGSVVSDNSEISFYHEWIHEMMYRIAHGQSYSDLMLEGVTTYMESVAFPENNEIRYSMGINRGYSAINSLLQRNNDVPHPKYSELRDAAIHLQEIIPGQTQELSYREGYLRLAAAHNTLVDRGLTYDQAVQKIINAYVITCHTTIIDSNRFPVAKDLVLNGHLQKNVTEDDLMRYALMSIGIDIESADYQTHLRNTRLAARIPKLSKGKQEH